MKMVIFSIVVNTKSKTTFSYVGYKSQSITIGKENIINIVLEADSENLNEIVITALVLKESQRN
jgi:hypothetical protein